ncbi:MAG: OmpA family protein [Bacteroidota bacterium]
MRDRLNRILPIAIFSAALSLALPLSAQPQNPPAIGSASHTNTDRQNLGPAINSGSIEILPIVSPDEKTIYFDRKYSRGNVGGMNDEDDIYYSTLGPNGTWLPAKNLGPPLNTPGSDVLFWISADGTTALVHNGGKINGKTIGLAISKRSNGTWGAPKPISVAGLGNLSEISDGYHANISPDGTRLLVAYSRDRANPENLDIYSCPALSNDYMRWGAPVSLGDSINSAGSEWAPWIASDNHTLYFASGGHGGYGATDLFISRRLDDTWQKWSAPVNMGPIINTAGYEASISIPSGGTHAYVSGVGLMGDATYGQSDIYRMNLDDSSRPRRYRKLAGRLTAAGRGIRGLVRVERLPQREVVGSATSDEAGGFRFDIPAGSEYRVTGWGAGHGEVSANVDARNADENPLNVMLELVDGAPGRDPSVVRRGPGADREILYQTDIDGFAVGSSDLPKGGIPRLTKSLQVLRDALAHEGGKVRVVGYTDDTGENDSNHVLSLARANSVLQWLRSNGVQMGESGGEISLAGQGESSPVASNDTPVGRARNRRVVIMVTIPAKPR